ncbi:hypothetical protein HOO65_060038 [Ceratocystis lukuohia]|uniref:Wings apart-like protein C-terminal domain-containing protein n=1 Tax=Ceratocystis lukuohia TaxID=2019550 RepID=A0ABR4MD66_9PEZI
MSAAPPRSSSHSRPSSIWTASRRHRLLRNLNNRLNNIRSILLPTNKPLNDEDTTCRRRSSSHNAPPLEDSKRQRKRTRITYSRKCRPAPPIETPRKPQVNNDDSAKSSRLAFRAPVTPGRVPLETPLVRKIRQVDTPGRTTALFDPETPSSRRQCHQDALPSIRADKSSQLHTEYDFVLRSIKTIIAQTRAERTNGLPGALMEMCLRKVTGVIQELQVQEEKRQCEAGSKSLLSDTDVTASIYTHLEAMNSQGPGWEPLRIVVLREATEMLKDSICEGLFDMPFIQTLIQQFATSELLSEASLLLETVTDIQYEPPSDETDAEVLPPTLALLYNFCKHNHKRDLLFRILEKLLFSGQLPGEWLSTACFLPIWSEALKALSNAAPCRTIMDFTAMALATLSHCIGVKLSPVSKAHVSKSASSALALSAQVCERTLISVLGAIVALAIVNQKTHSGSTTKSGTITRRIVFILTHCVSYARKKFRRSRKRDCISVLTLACYLSGHNSSDLNCRDWDSVAALAGSYLEKPLGSFVDSAVYDTLVKLASSIAHGASRGSTIAPHRHLLKLCEALNGVVICGRPLGNIKVDGAILLSQRTGDLRDVVFAEGLSGKRRRPVGFEAEKALQNPKGMYSGYQWDDALSEWVDCTSNCSNAPSSRCTTPVNVTTRQMKRTLSTISSSSSSSHRRQSKVLTPPTPADTNEDLSENALSDHISDEDEDTKVSLSSNEHGHLSEDDDELSQCSLTLPRMKRDVSDSGSSMSLPGPRRPQPLVKMSMPRRKALLKVQRSSSYTKMLASKPHVTLTSIGSWAGASSDDELI